MMDCRDLFFENLDIFFYIVSYKDMIDMLYWINRNYADVVF
jgi:hypothetical protein